MYARDISDSIRPEDFQDLKIIKKGEGAAFIRDVILSTGENKELKTSLDYHKKFMDNNTGSVVLSDFDHMKGTSRPQNISQGGKFGAPSIDNANQSMNQNHVSALGGTNAGKGNFSQTMRTAANTLASQDGYATRIGQTNQFAESQAIKTLTLDQESKLHDAENLIKDNVVAEQIEATIGISEHYKVPRPTREALQKATFMIQLIDQEKRVDLAQSLNLPEGLWPTWKVENRLYDIYYIPGYDNWMYEHIKKDPKRIHHLSDYKKAYFENMLKTQNPELFERYIRDKVERPDCLPTISGANMSQTISPAAASNLQSYSGRGQVNTAGQHQAKRESNLKFGSMRSEAPDQKLQTGTEFWQTSYQTAHDGFKSGAVNSDNKVEMATTLYNQKLRYTAVHSERGIIRHSAGPESASSTSNTATWARILGISCQPTQQESQ